MLEASEAATRVEQEQKQQQQQSKTLTNPSATRRANKAESELKTRLRFACPQATSVSLKGRNKHQGEEQSTRTKTAESQSTADDFACLAAENSRCNCHGRRRSTLSGLIELFEQKLQPSEDQSASLSKHQQAIRSKMRDIITQVNYQPADQSDDSLESSCSEQSHKWLPSGPALDARKLTALHWQKPTNGSQFNNQKRPNRTHRNQDRTQSCSGTASSCSWASLGPHIVRHQPSSSRRLLQQLARLRRLDQPNYRVRRPEKVAQVESLIDQLERTTLEWEDDEELLERAERRDWPQQYHEQYAQMQRSASPVDADTERQTRLDFGQRDDITQLEQETILRSHSASLSRASSSNLRSIANRYHDDLAVRKLARAECSSRASEQPLMSYLLCSNAYTPSMDCDSGLSLADTLTERRVLDDDLLSRSLRRKLDPQEPPFGIPRTGWSSLPKMRTQRCYATNCDCSARINQKRSDSRVSFMETVERHSADSGLAASPVSTGRQSASNSWRNRPASRLSSYSYDDAAAEQDLELELMQSDNCQSPALECYTVEYRSNLGRSMRPKIRIEHPRAKSPLLRVSNSEAQAVADDRQTKPSTPVEVQSYEESLRRSNRKKDESELECHYTFDEDEDADSSEDSRLKTRRARLVTTWTDSGESSNEPAADESNSDTQRLPAGAKKDSNGPKFSIGHYKSAKKSDLKIL